MTALLLKLLQQIPVEAPQLVLLRKHLKVKEQLEKNAAISVTAKENKIIIAVVASPSLLVEYKIIKLMYAFQLVLNKQMASRLNLFLGDQLLQPTFQI